MFRRTLAGLVALAFLAVAGAASSSGRALPQRIVSLSPTATEDLFAIGAGKQVIAADDQSDYPKAALAKRTRLSGFTPNAEAIAGYKPDLVVLSYDAKGIVSALRKLGLRVLHLDAAKTLDGAYAQIGELGAVTGHRAEAGVLVRSMKTRIAGLVASVQSARGLSVYHELGPDLYSATSKTFIGRIYSLFGLKNIADAADASSTGYPQLSAEYVVSADPDLIVLADTTCCGQTPATVAARPGWSGLKAVKTYSIVRIDDSIASRWGPRIVNFARAIAAALKRLG
ncbi:MAG: ABC transporter substrate-binding protein [Actinobacteria bacterium]|nr:MAG: ABC transporter substrate-binding protein [Actinomycetota bacterium]